MKSSIAAKILGGSVTNIALIFLLSAVSWWTISELRQMQGAGIATFRDALQASKASAMGAELYQIIADAEINREFEVTAKDWAAKKADAEQSLNKVEQTAQSNQERTAIVEARTAYRAIVRIFVTAQVGRRNGPCGRPKAENASLSIANSPTAALLEGYLGTPEGYLGSYEFLKPRCCRNFRVRKR